MKTFLTKHASTITAIGSLVAALWGAFEQHVAAGKPVTGPEVAMVLGAAFVGWLSLRRPGDLTGRKAEQLADQRANEAASEALRSVSMAPPLDLPGRE